MRCCEAQPGIKIHTECGNPCKVLTPNPPSGYCSALVRYNVVPRQGAFRILWRSSTANVYIGLEVLLSIVMRYRRGVECSGCNVLIDVSDRKDAILSLERHKLMCMFIGFVGCKDA